FKCLWCWRLLLRLFELALCALDHAVDFFEPLFLALLLLIGKRGKRRDVLPAEVDEPAWVHSVLEHLHDEGCERIVAGEINAPICQPRILAVCFFSFCLALYFVAELIDENGRSLFDKGARLLLCDAGQLLALGFARLAVKPCVWLAGVGVNTVDNKLL